MTTLDRDFPMFNEEGGTGIDAAQSVHMIACPRRVRSEIQFEKYCVMVCQYDNGLGGYGL